MIRKNIVLDHKSLKGLLDFLYEAKEEYKDFVGVEDNLLVTYRYWLGDDEGLYDFETEPQFAEFLVDFEREYCTASPDDGCTGCMYLIDLGLKNDYCDLDLEKEMEEL